MSIGSACRRSLPLHVSLCLLLFSVGSVQAGGANEGAERSQAGLPIPVTVVLQVGDTPAGAGGERVDNLNYAFTNGVGQVGFNGTLTSGERFIWFDDGIIFLDSNAPRILTAGQNVMGISDDGGFIYAPHVDLDVAEAVWSHHGLVLRSGYDAPGFGFPYGTLNTANRRPTMLPNGQAYWIAGFDDTGGDSALGTVLYTSPTASAGDIQVVLRSDQIVDGLTIDRPTGIGTEYQISDNGLHHIHSLLMDTGSVLDDSVIYVDGSLVARESYPDGGGANWQDFDVVSINNSGNYLFSGDNDGPTNRDEFLAYNGAVVVREGDTIGGIPLSFPANVLGVSLNNVGWAVHAWRQAEEQYLFVACRANDLASSVVVAATGDEVDVDGDGLGDATIYELGVSSVVGNGLWLAEDGNLYIQLELDFGTGHLAAIVRIDLPCSLPIIFSDNFESGDTSAWPTTITP